MYKSKKAFTLIELIFAIVVIAISVMSLPMMIQSTQKGIEGNIIQEAIFASSGMLNEATTYYWDEHSLNDENVSAGYSRVVNTTTGGCLGGSPNRRIGHINRRCLDNNATMPFTGTIFTKSLNITEHGATPIFITGSSPSAATYKAAYENIVDVNNCAGGGCVQFGLEANNPNLKEIDMQIIPSGGGTTLIRLRAYSANIGEVAPESKVF